MSSDISKRIESILGFLEESVKEAKGFAAKESPDVVRQVLQWAVWGNILSSISCVVFGLVIAAGQKMFSFWYVANNGPEDFPYGWIFLSSILYLLPLFGVLLSIEDMAQALVAPKVYLLEYVKKLMTPPSKDE